MPLPDYETLMLPVLHAFSNGAKSVSETLPLLRQQFDITDEEAAELIPSGRVTVLANRAHWARTYLAKAGLITAVKRNHHAITAAGQALLAQNPTVIDNATLSQFDEFSKWKDGTNVEEDAHLPGAATPANPIGQNPTSATPDELFDHVFKEIDGALQAEILDRLYVMNPVRFEKLILDLLRAMGYGAGALSNHLMTKTSGDGGIDGIIHEDALGLDAVYIQAKRYAADNRVGRPMIQQFVGSLTGEGAVKGVFVTTSDFSKEARDYLAKVQHRVVLINGKDLARLMVRHSVGVRDRQTYIVREVDEGYFGDLAD